MFQPPKILLLFSDPEKVSAENEPVPGLKGSLQHVHKKSISALLQLGPFPESVAINMRVFLLRAPFKRKKGNPWKKNPSWSRAIASQSAQLVEVVNLLCVRVFLGVLEEDEDEEGRTRQPSSSATALRGKTE